jgi:hypothetical protein
MIDDDDVYLKTDYNEGVAKSNPTQKCRPTKGRSKRVNIQIIKDLTLSFIEQLIKEIFHYC